MKKGVYILILLFSVRPGFSQTQFTGGVGSGFTRNLNSAAVLSITDSTFNGGNGTGFTKHNPGPLTLSITDSLHNGGEGTGFTKRMTALQLSLVDSLYNGAIGRGDTKSQPVALNLGFCVTDTITWNGNYSMSWNNDANWDCGVLPGVNSVVVIPSGKNRYPVIPVDIEIKTLFVLPGASVLVVTGRKLTINGQ